MLTNFNHLNSIEFIRHDETCCLLAFFLMKTAIQILNIKLNPLWFGVIYFNSVIMR
jgi:hypothetical protein